MNEDFGESFKGRRTRRISPKLRERQRENPSIRKESVTRFFLMDMLSSREEFGRETFQLVGNIGRIRNISQKTCYKRSPDIRKNREFVFPVADGTAKLSGRDYELQESTLRRESTVMRENLKG